MKARTNLNLIGVGDAVVFDTKAIGRVIATADDMVKVEIGMSGGAKLRVVLNKKNGEECKQN